MGSMLARKITDNPKMLKMLRFAIENGMTEAEIREAQGWSRSGYRRRVKALEAFKSRAERRTAEPDDE